MLRWPVLLAVLFSSSLFSGFLAVPVARAIDEVPDSAEPLQIAVAANFEACLRQIAAACADRGGPPAVLIVGSTGRHFAQIKNGAPFDLFFAADEERPRLLEQEGYAAAGSRFTYALGRLVLWAPGVTASADAAAAEVLAAGRFRHLAIANPRLAPYGRAARQTLEALRLWDDLSDRLVTGQSVGQAWQFVASGAAEAGLLAASQAVSVAGAGGVFPVPPHLHGPIIQQVVLLNRAAENPAARAFLDFLRGPEARALIRSAGYGIAEGGAP